MTCGGSTSETSPVRRQATVGRGSWCRPTGSIGARISTVIVVAITSNPRLAAAPGNVALPSGTAGLTKDSVVNVSQVITVDRALLGERIGQLARERLVEVDRGLRLALGL